MDWNGLGVDGLEGTGLDWNGTEPNGWASFVFVVSAVFLSIYLAARLDLRVKCLLSFRLRWVVDHSMDGLRIGRLNGWMIRDFGV